MSEMNKVKQSDAPRCDCDDIQSQLDMVSLEFETMQHAVATASNDLKICREDRNELKTRYEKESKMMVEKAVADAVQTENSKGNRELKMLREENQSHIRRLEAELKLASDKELEQSSHTIDLDSLYTTKLLAEAYDAAMPYVPYFSDTAKMAIDSVKNVKGKATDFVSQTVIPMGEHIYGSASVFAAEIYEDRINPLLLTAEESMGFNREDLKRVTDAVLDKRHMLTPYAHSIISQTREQSLKLADTMKAHYPGVATRLPSSTCESVEFLCVAVMLYFAVTVFVSFSTKLVKNTFKWSMTIIKFMYSLTIMLIRIPIIVMTCGIFGRSCQRNMSSESEKGSVETTNQQRKAANMKGKHKRVKN